MSYAIAPTFEANKIGVRRIYTLAGLGDAPDPDTIAELEANGYDPGDVQTAVALGATDAQLLSLPYPADPETESNAMQSLIMSLSMPSMAPPPVNMQTSAVGTAYGAAASAASTIVSVAGQSYDLTQEASWQALASLISQWQSVIQGSASSSNSADATNVNNFNAAVAQFAGAYQQVMGTGAPVGSVTLSGLGVIPVVVVIGVVAIVAAALVAMYAAYQYFAAKKAANAAQAQIQTSAVTGVQTAANSLLAQANSLATSNPTQAAALRAQAAAMLGQTVTSTTPAAAASATPITVWLENNGIAIAAILFGSLVLIKVVKKS